MTTKISSNKIAKFITEKISLQENQTYAIYSYGDDLAFTTGSMEYRDEEHKQILVFKTGDDSNYSFAGLKRAVEYFMDEQNGQMKASRAK